MFKWLKYLPLAALGKNVSEAYKEETGKERPAYLSRRVIGAALVLAGGFTAIQSGVQIDANILNSITDSLDKIIAAGITLYGTIIFLIGLFKRKIPD
jgi:hypothetical protein